MQECIDEEDDVSDSYSGVSRSREIEADSGVSRTTDDSLRNDESSEHEMIDTDSAASPTSSSSAKYIRCIRVALVAN